VEFISLPKLSPSREPCPHRATARRWGGPVLALIGAAIIAAIVLQPAASESPLSWWILNSALTPERLLPLIGFGVALGFVSRQVFFGGFLLFGGGVAAGFILHDQLLAPFWTIPNMAPHNFVTGPIASTVVGIALVAGNNLRRWLLPPAALVAGVMQALAIVVTDPSLHDPTNRISGVLIAIWIVSAISLSLRTVRRAWFEVASRIFGSWLIAIGLLYGGAALLPKRELPALSFPPSPEEDFGRPFPSGERND
jgi:hypothetical protein